MSLDFIGVVVTCDGCNRILTTAVTYSAAIQRRDKLAAEKKITIVKDPNTGQIKTYCTRCVPVQSVIKGG